MRKDRLRRLARATQGGREREEMAEAFLNSVARLKAAANGEEPPPEHPRARDPRFAAPFMGPHAIQGGGSGPVEDLSEPEQSRAVRS